MRKVILIVISAMALCAIAPAQGQQWIQSWSWNKKSDVLPKEISNFAIIEMNRKGVKACRFIVDDMRPVLMASDGKFEINLNLLNIITEHMKYAWIRPSLADGKEQSVTNRGGDTSSKNRTVYGPSSGVGFKELNTYQLGDGHNGFGGDLDISKARPGINGILLQADTKHVDQHELGPIQVGSQKRRNWLQDAITVNIQSFKNDMDLYVAMGRDGWYFENSDLQLYVDECIEKGLIPSRIMSAGQSQTQKDDDKQKTKGGVILDLDNLDNAPVVFSLNSRSFSGGACKESDELLISCDRPFRLQVFSAASNKLIKDKLYDSPTNKGDYAVLLNPLNKLGKCQIDVVDPKTGLLMATITLEVK